MSHVRRVAEVAATLEPHRWLWAEANAVRIAEHWARRKGERPNIFNGRVLMLTEIEESKGIVRARFFETDYANMIAWLDLGCPDESVANGFAMAALRSRDGQFILGRMGEHTANAGQLYFPAGTPDLGDVQPGGQVDLAGSLLRELTEETGLGPADWTVEDGWTIVEEDGRAAFLRGVRLSMTADEACRRIRAFLAAETRPELAGVEIVSAGDDDHASVPAFLRTYLSAVAPDQTS